MSSTSRRRQQATLLVRHARQGWRDWRQRWTWSRSGGQIVGASQGSLEKVRNTKRRGTAAARGDQRLVLQGRRGRSQAGRDAVRRRTGSGAGRTERAERAEKERAGRRGVGRRAQRIFLTCLARHARHALVVTRCHQAGMPHAGHSRSSASQGCGRVGTPGARIGGSACWRGRAEPTVSHRRHRRRPAVLRRRPTAAKACGHCCPHHAASARPHRPLGVAGAANTRSPACARPPWPPGRLARVHPILAARQPYPPCCLH
jgi:hypothetical protein